MNTSINLETLMNFKGYGNAKLARILFVGIEEGGEWKNEDMTEVNKKLQIREKGYITRDEWHIDDKDWKENKRNITDNMQATLSFQIRTQVLRIPTEKEFESFYNNEFCERIEFQANLFPLGSKGIRRGYPPHYHKYFEPTMKNKKKFKEYCVGIRTELIINFIHDIWMRGGYVFIMGKLLNRYLLDPIRDRLGIEFIEYDVQISERRIFRSFKSADQKIWFTGHPSYGWFNKKCVQLIIDKITRSRN